MDYLTPKPMTDSSNFFYPEATKSVASRVVNYVDDVKSSKLKVNPTKTEFLWAATVLDSKWSKYYLGSQYYTIVLYEAPLRLHR